VALEIRPFEDNPARHACLLFSMLKDLGSMERTGKEFRFRLCLSFAIIRSLLSATTLPTV